MQKLDEKLNGKSVGATSSRPCLKEATLKKQNGITLIALIITIIVMLILVGVTINVALNGGLFEKAETATRATEEKAILEEMLSMMEITDDRKIDYNAIITKMKQKYEVKYSYPNAEITGKLEIYNYIVSETEIKIGISNVDYSSELEKYFFNDDGTGKTGLVTQDENTGAITFNNDANTIADASTSILFMNYGEGYITIEYKGADYRIDAENMDSLDTVSATIGEDNEKVTKLETIYSGNDDETKIKQYFLGYSGTGKYFPNLLDMELTVDGPVLKDNNIISNASETITLVDKGEDYATIQYNGADYVIEVDAMMIINNAYKIIEYEEPIVYEGKAGILDTNVIIIEKSNLEVYYWMDAANSGMKGIIKICNNLEELGSFVEINEGNIKYSKVLISSAGELVAVYNEDNKTWYLIISSERNRLIDHTGTVVLTSNVSKEKVDTIIETIDNASS